MDQGHETVAAEVVVIPAALAELREQPRWVCWRLERNEQGKLTKVPYQPSGLKASTDDASTWSTYDNVTAAAGNFAGIGFVLTGGEIAAFDLDKCRDPATGTVEDWAEALIARAASYTEITPSGTGLRIIGRGGGEKVHRKLNGNGINCEVYRKAVRYITVTGIVHRDAPLANIDAVIDDFIAEFDGARRREARQDSGRGGADLPPSVASLLSVRGSGAYRVGASCCSRSSPSRSATGSATTRSRPRAWTPPTRAAASTSTAGRTAASAMSSDRSRAPGRGQPPRRRERAAMSSFAPRTLPRAQRTGCGRDTCCAERRRYSPAFPGWGSH
jgi:hypothetical protein